MAIRQHPENQRYFEWNERPEILITSGEHYGSLIHLGFDYHAYFKHLKSHGFNLTRTFAGIYRERPDRFGIGSQLSPKGMGEYCSPWAWSNENGGYDGRKLDLDKWNEAYFTRLVDYLSAAGKNGIVVEIVLFSNNYENNPQQSNWRRSPLYPENNIQRVGALDQWTQFYSTNSNPELLEYQKAYVRKMVMACKEVDNVYFEICNEPPHNGDERDVLDWHNAMIDVIVETEEGYAETDRHMIAVDYDTQFQLEHLHDSVSLINTHYAYGDGWIGAFVLLDKCRSLKKILGLDETEFLEVWGQSDPESTRVEAWEFILGGGSVYDHLNGAYLQGKPTGDTPASNKVKEQLRNLSLFIKSFDFIKMSNGDAIIAGGIQGPHARARCLCEPGKQYALYIHHSKIAGEKSTGYEPIPGDYQNDLRLHIRSGSYSAKWFDPSSLMLLAEQTISIEGAQSVILRSPLYRVDIVLSIVSYCR